MELTNEFLLQKSRQWGLTGEQEAVLVRKFGQRQSNRDIAADLKISTNACVQCLGEIYRKAGIEGNSRGKAHRLQACLVQEAAQFTPEAPSTYISDVLSKTPPTVLAPSDVDEKGNRQYLEDLLEQLQQQAQELNDNPDGEAADKVFELLSEKLPRSTVALASESNWKRVDVVRQIIHQVSKLFTTIDPTLEKCDGLAFLSPENSFGNPLHRSITAFVQRIGQQLAQDNGSSLTVDEVLQAVMNKGRRYFKNNTALSPYSAWVRQNCLHYLMDQFGVPSNAEPIRLLDREGVNRNLLAIDVACLEMYLSAKQDDAFDLNYFDILVARWLKGIPWQKDVDNSSVDQEQLILNIDPADLEWAALSTLRRQYHQLDNTLRFRKYGPLHRYFLDCLEDVKNNKYATYFWLDYENIKAFGQDDSKIVSIPRAILGKTIDRETCETIAEDVHRYCELATYHRLGQEEIYELKHLLEKACQSSILDFWFNEIDHFMDHQLNRQKNVATHTGLSQPMI